MCYEMFWHMNMWRTEYASDDATKIMRLAQNYLKWEIQKRHKLIMKHKKAITNDIKNDNARLVITMSMSDILYINVYNQTYIAVRILILPWNVCL